MRNHWLIFLCLAVVCGACSKSPVTTEKTYPLGPLGALTLTFPGEWTAELIELREGTTNLTMTFSAIRFGPTNGSNFAFQVQLIPIGEKRVATFGIKSQLLQSGQIDLTNAVESSLNILEFTGTNTAGAYFRVTDKRWTKSAPTPGEFKSLTQGLASLGPFILSFRLVSNDPRRDEPMALEVIKSARLTKPQPATPPPVLKTP